MKGKKTLTRALAVCLAAVMCLSLIGAIAPAEAVQASTLSANVKTLNTGVKIYIESTDANGVVTKTRFIPRDVSGNEVVSFIVEDLDGGGTTYLPIRAVSQIFGAAINWDAGLKSVVVQTPEQVTIKNTSAGADSSSSFASADSNVFTGINIIVDNYAFTPKDAKGNKVDTILIEDANGGGTTYLPLRAMTEIFLKGASDVIAWNGAAREVTLKASSASTQGEKDETILSAKHEGSGPYDTVFVHGLLGWGPEDGVDALIPYWGLLKEINSQGFNSVAATVGPISSCWDRSCELFAQLTGTVVDYGAAHSAAAEADYASKGYDLPHHRYGRDYTDKAIVKDWGPIYESGKVIGFNENKINLVGHSFGGPTIVEFLNILAEGDANEIAWGKAQAAQAEKNGEGSTDWHDYVSPFFWGDYDGEYLVNSLTSLAGVLNGTTFINVNDTSTKLLENVALILGNGLGQSNLFGGVYDFQLEHFGMTKSDGLDYGSKWSRVNQIALEAGYDQATYDMSMGGNNKLKQGWKTYDNVYYFSFAGDVTRASLIPGKRVPKISSASLFYVFALNMCRYQDRYNEVMDCNGRTLSGITDEWAANDGMVNTIAAKYPLGLANKKLDTGNIEPGVWQWAVKDMDHVAFSATTKLLKPVTSRAFYKEIIANITATY